MIFTNNRHQTPIIIGAITGLAVGIALLAISFGCERFYQIPNGGGYTSEDVWGCTIPLSPTVMISYLIQTVISLKEPTIGIGYFIFHIVFYTLVGLFIGWIVYKIKYKAV